MTERLCKRVQAVLENKGAQSRYSLSALSTLIPFMFAYASIKHMQTVITKSDPKEQKVLFNL